MREKILLFSALFAGLIAYRFLKRQSIDNNGSLRPHLYKLCSDPARCCAEIRKAYPDYSKAGVGMSMEELRSKYGEEVMEYWVHYACTNGAPVPDPGVCDRIKAAYNIAADGSNLCSLPSHEKVAYNENACQPAQNFNNCPPPPATDCDKLRVEHPDFAADVAAGVDDRNLLAKYGMTLWSQWRNAQC
jgi:hypothetical protein